MNISGVFGYLKGLLQKKEDGKQMSKKEKWILFLLVGLLFVVIWMPMEEKKENATLTVDNLGNEANITPIRADYQTYETYLSEQLGSILQEIDGAGNVEAWVTIAESEEKIVYLEGTKDTSLLQEEDSEGGIRKEEKKTNNQTVLVDSKGEPYVVKTIQPKVEGVFVVAEGADDSVVKKNITDAIEVLFDIDVHRIKVAKKKMED